MMFAGFGFLIGAKTFQLKFKSENSKRYSRMASIVLMFLQFYHPQVEKRSQIWRLKGHSQLVNDKTIFMGIKILNETMFIILSCFPTENFHDMLDGTHYCQNYWI